MGWTQKRGGSGAAISRRNFLASGAAATLGMAVGSNAGAQGRPPNILFILADDLGYADLSCYGRRDYETPNIDRLAREGVRLTSAYANSPVCSPTRVALMTGRYQYRLPAGLEEPISLRNKGLPPAHPTLPSLLRTLGYRSSLIGKWHLGSLPDYGPLKSGYDEFWGIRGGAVDYFSHESPFGYDLWDGAHEVRETGYLTDLLGDRAVETIRSRSAKTHPFMIGLHFTAPHWPWLGPENEAESGRLAESSDPASVLHYDGGSLATYAAMVTRMDYQVGRVLAELEAQGIANNTIVIFTSDNGGERFSDNWPFTGMKTELLEGGLRIPAIVRYPGRIAPGSVHDQVTISMDWVPTLVAAAGGECDPGYPPDGMNILPMIDGNHRVPRTLHWRYRFNRQKASRDGDWKYLKIRDNEFLFDLSQDPRERANLKNRYPETFDRLVAAHEAWDRQMLPLDPEAMTYGFSGRFVPDRYGMSD